MKGGKAIIVIGGTGMGKSTFVKSCLSHVHKENIWLYDVNNEYREYINPLPELPSFQNFCDKASKLNQSVIVFEEATIFLNNKGSNQKLIDILVRKRHTENLIILVFHSLRSMPKYLLDLCNVLVLHKTNDPLEIAERFDNDALLKAYQYIKAAPMLPGSNGKMYSPSKAITLLS